MFVVNWVNRIHVFFLTRRCRRCRRHDGSSMLSRIRQSTPLYLLLALPSCFFLSCLLLRYVSTFERDVFAEGEESLRREFIMRGFMGSLKGSLFGIIYFLRYYLKKRFIFSSSMFW